MHPGPDAFLNQVVGGRWRLLEAARAIPVPAFRVFDIPIDIAAETTWTADDARPYG